MYLEIMKNNVVVAIDDIHPEKDWGVEGDVQIEYHKALNDKFGVKNENSCKFRVHSQTGGVTLTAQQPLNNALDVLEEYDY